MQETGLHLSFPSAVLLMHLHFLEHELAGLSLEKRKSSVQVVVYQLAKGEERMSCEGQCRTGHHEDRPEKRRQLSVAFSSQAEDFLKFVVTYVTEVRTVGKRPQQVKLGHCLRPLCLKCSLDMAQHSIEQVVSVGGELGTSSSGNSDLP